MMGNNFTFEKNNAIEINEIIVAIPDHMTVGIDEDGNTVCVPKDFFETHDGNVSLIHEVGSAVFLSPKGMTQFEAGLIWKLQSPENIAQEAAEHSSNSYGVPANVFCAKPGLVIVWYKLPHEVAAYQFLAFGLKGQASGFVLFRDSMDMEQDERNVMRFLNKIRVD